MYDIRYTTYDIQYTMWHSCGIQLAFIWHSCGIHNVNAMCMPHECQMNATCRPGECHSPFPAPHSPLYIYIQLRPQLPNMYQVILHIPTYLTQPDIHSPTLTHITLNFNIPMHGPSHLFRLGSIVLTRRGEARRGETKTKQNETRRDETRRD